MKIQSQQFTQETTLFRFGKPFQTDAVVRPVPTTGFTPADGIPGFNISSEKGSIILERNLDDDEAILGLGEMLGGINKRGKKYKIYSTDDPFHTPDKGSLYGAHPFLLFSGKEPFGLFIDFPGEIEVDCGFTERDRLVITISGKDVDCYLFVGDSPLSLVRSLLELTGSPYLPPRWAFGYFQSRWSYPDAKSVKKIASRFREENIPCDGIFLDLDYMDNLKVFTTSDERFPDFASFISSMKDDGFEIIPIVDPGVKVEKGYDVYENGKKGKHFCIDSSGKEFYSAVWPGKTVFPDFLNSSTREWWGDLYKPFVEMGLSAFWNDMNEPSIFYTPSGLKKLHKEMAEFSKLDDPGMELFSIQHSIKTITNRREYYSEFNHTLDDGTVVNHETVHNLFGFNMARATADGLKRLLDNRRHLLLSRASYMGLHRFATIWTGDNASWWEHLGLQIRMMISCNMCGLFFTGADIGGFGHNADAELVARWSALGVVTPFYRNHAALFTRDQEPWAFDEKTMNIIADLIRIRYALIPYLYSTFAFSRQSLQPFISPLFFYYYEPSILEIDDQFMIGPDLMAAPVIESGKQTRYVTLPGENWLYWPAASWDNRSMKVMEAGVHRIEAPLSVLPLFIPENHVITMTEPASHTRQQTCNKIICTGLVTSQAQCRIYLDDGISYDHEQKRYIVVTITIKAEKKDFFIKTEMNWGDGTPVNRDSLVEYRIDLPEMIFLELYDDTGSMNSLQATLRIADA
jgi:alpha-glucosidase